MKLAFNPHGLMYDICNWAFNITLVAFLWSTNHWWCVAIVGLFVLRMLGDYLYRKSVFAEHLAARAKIMQQLGNENASSIIKLLDEEEILQEDEFEEVLDEPTKPKEDDKKVH